MHEHREDRTVDPRSGRLSRRTALRRAGAAGVALAGAARLSRPSASASRLGAFMTQATPTATGAPTVVLVHGAFADASSWPYPDVFAADVPKAVTMPAAYAQRPVAPACWKAWAVLGPMTAVGVL